MSGGKVRCTCGAVVAVPEAGQYVPCPQCRRMVTFEARPLLEAETVPVASPAPTPGQPSDEALCPGCGVPVAPDAVICLACGFRLTGGAPRAAEPAEGGKAKYVLLAVALLILGGAVAGIIYAARKPPEPIRSEKSGYMYTTVHQISRAKQMTALLTARQNIQAFQALNGRFPRSLDELAQNDMPCPPPPEGMAYDYDPKSGNIELINAPEPAPSTTPAPSTP